METGDVLYLLALRAVYEGVRAVDIGLFELQNFINVNKVSNISSPRL